MISTRTFPIAIGFFGGIAAIAFALLIGENHVEQAQLAARWTARIGFPIFLLCYLASSLFKIKPNQLTKTVMKRRRQWGLAFAITHTIHLGALTYFIDLSGNSVETTALIGGGFAYFILYVMALTSNGRSVRMLGKYWKPIHSFGIHYLWFIFTFTYAGRLAHPAQFYEGAFFVSVAMLALITRIYARYTSR